MRSGVEAMRCLCSNFESPSHGATQNFVFSCSQGEMGVVSLNPFLRHSEVTWDERQSLTVQHRGVSRGREDAPHVG